MIIGDHAFGPNSPFNDKELALVNKALGTIKFDYVYKTCAVKCKHGKTPTKKMMEWCESRLKEEILLMKPNIIISLGKGPATIFNISGAIDKVRTGVYDVTGLKGIEAKLIITQPLDKILDDPSMMTEFLSDFKKAEKFADPANLKKIDLSYEMFETAEEFQEWCERTLAYAQTVKEQGKRLVIASDIETTGLDPRAANAKVRTIGFCWSAGRGKCLPYELDKARFRPWVDMLFRSPNIEWVFHNAVFDLSYLRVAEGLHVANLVGDTMLMAYLLDPTRGVWGYGLKPLAQEHTDLGAYDTEVKNESWEEVSLDILAPYNVCDCDATWRLYRLFYERLRIQNMLNANAVITTAVRVICDMQINGVNIDTAFVADTIPKMEALVKRYEEELEALAGEAIDWNSPKELGKFMYDRLGYTDPYGSNGQPTGDDALDRLNTPFTRTLQKYRKSFKLLSVYFKGYFSKVHDDSRLRARYNLTGTQTGRLSSSEPNFQNLPRGLGKDDICYNDMKDFKVKNAIVARPGWCLVAADQSQVEMRVAALVSRDPDLTKIFVDDLDLHSMNARVAFSLKVPVEREPGESDLDFLKRELKWIKANKDVERTASKSVSFGVLYGMGPKGLKFDLDGKTRSQGKVWDVNECKIFIDRFHANYRVLSKWISNMQDFASKHGYTYTLFGRRRWLPYATNKSREFSYERLCDLRAAINTPIQSAASDIMILGIDTIRQNIDPEKALIIASVHDSVVLEVREDYADEVKEIVRHSLTNPLLMGKPIDFLKGVPLKADVEVGYKYGDMK